MKKLMTYAVAALIIIVLIVAVMFIIHAMSDGSTIKAKAETVEPIEAGADEEEFTQYAEKILALLKADAHVALAELVHPEYGVVFSPCATITLTTDRRFTASQVEDFGKDSEKYIWGVYNGSGDPIVMTPADYREEFIWDADYTQATEIGVDRIVMKGNALENIWDVYPDARYIDFYVAAPPASNAMDWHSLRLVFEEYRGRLMLSGIVHSEYTI